MVCRRNASSKPVPQTTTEKNMKTTSTLTALATAVATTLAIAAHAQNPVVSAGTKTVVSGETTPGKILSIIVPITSFTGDQDLPIHVMGSGKVCRFHLVVINTDTNKESYFPHTEKFPVLTHTQLPLAQFPHGSYKVAAMAWDSDKTSGMACQGGGEYTAFSIVRPKIVMPTDWPKITELALAAGKSTAANTYRPDESLNYTVVGSNNKQCGWTLQATDGNGQTTNLGIGKSFTSASVSLSAFKEGSYTLTAKTTPADDNQGVTSCLGTAAKKITIVATPGKINDVKLYAFGLHGHGTGIDKWLDDGNTAAYFPFAPLFNIAIPDNGFLKITPVITGPTCAYSMTAQSSNGGKFELPFLAHILNVADKLPALKYTADKTLVTVTIKGAGAPQLACEGSASKFIWVQDDPKLPPETK
jgi:hypothetical protein